MQRPRNRQGFTLVEVMVVVVIIGVLGTLAAYGVRKYIGSARASEAAAVLNSIRGAEEVYHQDTFQYLDVSQGTFDNLHPSVPPGAFKRNWAGDGDHPPTTHNFRQLGVEVAGPVSFSYGVVAGRAGDAFPVMPTQKTAAQFNFPAAAAGDFYVALAKADFNGDGKFSYVVTHSLTQELYSENDGQ